MKKIFFIISIIAIAFVTPTITSCKALAKTAIKHWTKKQKKEFIAKCKDGTFNKFGEKTSEICSCVATVAEEKYPKIEDAMKMKPLEIIQLAVDCK